MGEAGATSRNLRQAIIHVGVFNAAWAVSQFGTHSTRPGTQRPVDRRFCVTVSGGGVTGSLRRSSRRGSIGWAFYSEG